MVLNNIEITALKKNRRSTRACDQCRTKRARLGDADQLNNVPCSSCVSTKQRCTFSLGPNRSSSHAYVESLERRLADYEKLLHQLAPHVDLTTLLDRDWTPEPSAASPRLPSPSARTPLQLKMGLAIRAIDHCLEPEVLLQTSHPSIDASEDLAHFVIGNRLKELRIASQYEFFGKSSSSMLVETAFETKSAYDDGAPVKCKMMSSLRPQFWTSHSWEQSALKEQYPVYTFPDEDLIWTLTDLHFQYLNSFLPLLHRPTFERNIRERLHLRDKKFAAVLLVVCALGSRYSDDPRALAEGQTSISSNGWKWFTQIKLFGQTWLSPPSLHDIQLACLSICFLHSGTSPHLTWTMIGVGIRLAQHVGAHRRRPPDQPLTVETELWKRAWWSLVCLDWLMSAAMGRPCAIHHEEFDAEMPIECDDEFWEHPDPKQAFKQPPNKPSVVSSFVHIIKLSSLTAITLRTLYGIKPLLGVSRAEYQEHILAGLDSALNKWLDSIPDHLRWDPDRENLLFFDQSVLLHTCYYHTQILVHKPFIPSPRRPLSTLSHSCLAMCTNAARACSRVVEVHNKRHDIPLPFCQVPAFTSAVVLLLYTWSSKKSGLPVDIEKQMADVRKCMTSLQRGEHRWPTAGRLFDILMDLASFGEGNFPYGGPNQSSYRTTKRPRGTEVDVFDGSREDLRAGSLEPPQRTVASDQMLQDAVPQAYETPLYHFQPEAAEDQLLFPYYSGGIMSLPSNDSDPFYTQLQGLVNSGNWYTTEDPAYTSALKDPLFNDLWVD